VKKGDASKKESGGGKKKDKNGIVKGKGKIMLKTAWTSGESDGTEAKNGHHCATHRRSEGSIKAKLK